MTTTYHTPYSNGGALTAAAMNVPLGQLDAAIGSGSAVFFNVMAYGATGDGSTDDSVAINDAIQACNTAGGGVVWVPESTYIVGGAEIVTLRSNVILRGAGYGSVLKLKASTVADVIKSAATSAGTAITFAGVEHLRIDGNKANQTANNDAQQYGISLDGAHDCWVDNVWVQDTKRSGIYLAGNRNRATNNRLSGIGAFGTGGTSIIGRAGIVFGVYNVTELFPIQSICRDNRMQDCLEHGIKLYDGGHGSVIEGNVVLAGSDNGIEIMGNNYCTVTGNVVSGASKNGIFIGDGTHAGIGNVVSANTVNGTLVGSSGGHGILVQNQTGTTVSGNNVMGSYGNGVYCLDSTENTVTGNHCKGNGTNGGSAGITFYQSPHGTIAGNTCSNNGTTGSRGSGILLWDAGTANTDITITANRCFDTAAGASKVQGYGIDSRDASNYLTVSANALRGNFTGTHTLVGANNVYTAGAV